MVAFLILSSHISGNTKQLIAVTIHTMVMVVVVVVSNVCGPCFVPT